MRLPRILLVGREWFGDLLAFWERGLLDLGADVRVIVTNGALRSRHATRLRPMLAKAPVVGPRIERHLYARDLKRKRTDFNRRVRETVREWQPDLMLAILCWEEV